MGNNDRREETQDSAIAKAVKEAINEALPVATAMAVKTMQAAQPVAAAPAPRPSTETCGVCRQRMSGCLGKHRMLAVYPAVHGKWFQGVIINGVKYLSNNTQHQIAVPTNVNFEHFISEWEGAEERMRTSNERYNNSGSISGMGA